MSSDAVPAEGDGFRTRRRRPAFKASPCFQRAPMTRSLSWRRGPPPCSRFRASPPSCSPLRLESCGACLSGRTRPNSLPVPSTALHLRKISQCAIFDRPRAVSCHPSPGRRPMPREFNGSAEVENLPGSSGSSHEQLADDASNHRAAEGPPRPRTFPSAPARIAMSLPHLSPAPSHPQDSPNLAAAASPTGGAARRPRASPAPSDDLHCSR